mmetsp:Transcript_28878/g.46753  ORF Transcript_28878/g.46753 Transcript_28878/m.46753 type:complete len:117 (-) Transcript_28878:667-1017(-)
MTVVRRPEVLRSYRLLLSAIDRSITRVRGDTVWRDFVRAEYRKNRLISDENRIGSLTAEAQNYAILLSCTKEYLDLLLDCGIGINKDSRQREMLHRTAAQVGLQLPAMFIRNESSR